MAGKIHYFHSESDGVNSASRILADLRDDGEVVSRKTVAKIMRHEGIAGIGPATWHPVTTTPEGARTIPDLVERNFDQGQLDLVWTSDIERHEALLNRAAVKGRSHLPVVAGG